MDPGIIVLGAIFSVAAFLLWWSFARARASRRKMLEAGFVACDQEAPALLHALDDVAGGYPPTPRREYQIGQCFKRPGGFGMVYRIGVVDRTNAKPDVSSDRAPMGARFDVYLIDLRDAERVSHGPVSVFLAPRAPAPLQRVLAGLVKSDPHGVLLEIDDPIRAKWFLAAFSDRAGKLDERLPIETQERLSKGAELYFLAAHFGAGKLALFGQHDRVDIDRQLAYVAEWT